MRCFIAVLVILQASIVGAQQNKTGFLKSKTDNTPVSYASLFSSKKGTYSFSNENGKFEIESLQVDSIKVSCVGYRDTSFIINDIKEETFFLEPQAKILPDVVIKKGRLVGKQKFGNANIKSEFNWGPSGYGEEFAQKIILPSDSADIFKLTKIFIPIKKFEPSFPVVLHLYRCDKITGMPSIELMLKPFVVTRDNVKRDNIVVDVSNDQIYLDDNEFFIGVEWLSKTVHDKSFGSGTLLLMTKSIDQKLTYSRTHFAQHYNWFALNVALFPNRPINTLFSVEVERYN